jgi:adenine-specific DNA-methyltransferase
MNKIKLTSKFDPAADLILYEGNILDLLKDVPNGFAKLVVTSPPYNLGKPYENKLHIDQYLKEQKKIIKECTRVLGENGSLCWQVGNCVKNGEILPLDILLYPIFSELNFHLRNRIVWHFGHGLHASKRFSGRYEVILWFTKSNNYTFNLDDVRVPQKYPEKKYFKGPKRGQLSGNPIGKNPSDIWEIPNVKANHVEKTTHPCQFPIELIERLVLSLTNKGDWVLDPFMGVGSTAIASLMHGRQAIGAEIMPEYIEITKSRIKSAENGHLKIRPMNRSVYDPNYPQKNIPPKTIKIKSNSDQLDILQANKQLDIFESKTQKQEESIK